MLPAGRFGSGETLGARDARRLVTSAQQRVVAALTPQAAVRSDRERNGRGPPVPSPLGVQVHKPGIAAALGRIEDEGLSNVKIARGDAVTALMDHVADDSLDECCIFFPDPFPQQHEAER